MKRIISFLFIFVTVLSLCSCGGNINQTEIDINSLGGYIAQNASFSEELEPVSSDSALMSFGIEASGIDAVEYATSSAVAEIFAAFKVQNSEDIAIVQKAVQDKIDYLKESYASYGPKEVPKIESAVVITRGNCVVFCISADNTQAKELIESYINR